jgi:F-type H+-transporting ATPase subunit a
MSLDLLASSDGGHGGGFDPMHHVVDSNVWNFSGPWGEQTIDLVHFKGTLIQTSLSSLFLWFTGIIMVFMIMKAASHYKKNPNKAPKGIANVVEALVVFIRNDVVYPNLGHKAGDKLLPMFLSLFFFLLTANYIGLLPFGFTVTSQITVTCAFALITFMFMFLGGFYVYKGKFFAHLVPLTINKSDGLMNVMMVPIWGLLLVLESVGMVIKSFALMMRLKANMMAGHVIIFTFLSLPSILAEVGMGTAIGLGTGVFGVFMSVFITVLELLVCFIQAYVFTLLSAIFIGHSVNTEHH